MLPGNETKGRYTFKLNDEQLIAIENFLQGAAYRWVGNED